MTKCAKRKISSLRSRGRGRSRSSAMRYSSMNSILNSSRRAFRIEILETRHLPYPRREERQLVENTAYFATVTKLSSLARACARERKPLARLKMKTHFHLPTNGRRVLIFIYLALPAMARGISVINQLCQFASL